jgi:hypothetical protein
MRRSIIECWSICLILWQWCSSFHTSQYRKRFCRLLTDFQSQLFNLAENDLNCCKHECRSRYSAFNNWSICMRLVFSQMSLRIRHLTSFHLRKKISFSTNRRSSHFRFRWFFLIVFWSFCEHTCRSFNSWICFENFFDFLHDFIVRFSFNRTNVLDQIKTIVKRIFLVAQTRSILEFSIREFLWFFFLISRLFFWDFFLQSCKSFMRCLLCD